MAPTTVVGHQDQTVFLFSSVQPVKLFFRESRKLLRAGRRLNEVPQGVVLAAGMTATVQINPAAARGQMNIPTDGSRSLALALQLRRLADRLALFRD